ncbi:MAG: nuclear transport factor 2 family protein [Micromonosporaceae bacterium]
MADLDRVAAWIDGYVRAWNSNDPADISALFTGDAEYYTAPYDPPWQGHTQIVEGWLADRDEPGETTFDWKPVLVTDEVAIIQAVTTYPATTYSNLWLIRLDGEGRCSSFTEWWMEHPTPPDA